MTDVDDDVQEELGDVEIPRWRVLARGLTVAVVAMTTAVLTMGLLAVALLLTIGHEGAYAHEFAVVWGGRAFSIVVGIAGGVLVGRPLAARLWMTPLERRAAS